MKDKTTTPPKVTPEVQAQLDLIRRMSRPAEQLELFDKEVPAPKPPK